MESSKYFRASVTSSQRSRELKIATLRHEETERQIEAKLRKNLLELKKLAKKNGLNWPKLP